MNNPYRFDKWEISPEMLYSLEQYVKEHIPLGDFLTAVLENNFVEAVGRADSTNIENLPAYAAWLYNEAPLACWGSKDAVNRWLEIKE